MSAWFGSVNVRTVRTGRAVNVEQAIAMLQKMPNKELTIMLDCPKCGHAQELTRCDEIVVLGTDETDHEETA
jgi:predicted RNA-binding Zn-ribbon protein involved in translation (DUF1610 family)